MRAVQKIAEKLRGCGLEKIHGARQKAVFFAVEALLRGKRLGVNALGRSGRSSTTLKHQIKRIDRLLGNRRLYAERGEFVGALARFLWRGQRHPRLLVDWTKLPQGRWALCAATPVGGRAILLYSEVYSSFEVNQRRVLERFVVRLARCLQLTQQVPVVITDAGFQGPWFDAVVRQGWHYLGAVPSTWQLRTAQSSCWQRVHTLFHRALRTSVDLGMCRVGRWRPAVVRRVILSPPCRSRHKSRSHYLSPHKKWGTQTYARKRAARPHVLMTSITDGSVAPLVTAYRTRMQIEETFRDLKNSRFGWGLTLCRSRTTPRWELLLLLASLTLLVVATIGLGLQNQSSILPFQANTLRSRHVLSWFVLATTLLQLHPHLLRSLHLPAAFQHLQCSSSK